MPDPHPDDTTAEKHNLTDFQNFSGQLEGELDKLDSFSDQDRQWVKRFVTHEDARLAPGSLAEYLTKLRKTAERLDCPLVALTETALDGHVYDLGHADEFGIGDGGMSDGTIRNYQFAVRKFLAFVDERVDDDDLAWAEDYDLVTPETNTVSPEDMLRPDDIRTLIDGANNYRDIAMIEFLADTGARLSLVGSLRVKDVDLDGERTTYRPNAEALGLKGAAIRPYPIIDAKASLRTYVRQVHPRTDRDDVALFHKVPGHGTSFEDGDGSISPTTIRKQLRKAAEDGGVEKPVNPHNFRHSAISRMRREGYDRGEIESRVHWKVDSDMWSVYEHISAEEFNEAIFERAGVVDGDSNGPTRERHPCGNCREALAPHHHWCPNCGDPVSPDAREAHTDSRETLLEGAADPERSERARAAATEAVRRLEDDPRIRPPGLSDDHE